ncbi:MAG: PaaI family thioesterase [Bacteroidales bacterium]|nr:PaaI family thioesterase [Bacteroidales bacterium]
MKKINNPFIGKDSFNCFGCSPDNHHGLKLEFWLNEEDNAVEANWSPKDYLQGYTDVLHGGVQATIMDEIASWVIYVLLETAGVTAKMEIRYLKPVIISNGAITIKAKFKSKKKRLVNIGVEIFDENNELCTEADVQYFVYPQELAAIKFNYPGIKAFIE